MQKCSSLFMRNSISIKIRWGGNTGNHILLWSFWTWTPWIKLCALQALGLVSCFARWTVWGDHITPLFKSIPVWVFRAFLSPAILTGRVLLLPALSFLDMTSHVLGLVLLWKFLLLLCTPGVFQCSLGTTVYWLSRRELHGLQESHRGCEMLQGGQRSLESLSKQNANWCVWLCSLMEIPPNAPTDLCLLQSK